MTDRARTVYSPEEPPPTVVVGGGPTGLTVANLLGNFGVPVVLVERNHSTSDAAKAISVDDESLRTMQMAGIDAEVMKIVVPGTGTRYFGASGRPLFHAHGAGGYVLGHPFKNPFAQPELERALRDQLSRFPHVDARFGTELLDVTSRANGATVRVRNAASGEDEIDAAAVLACDGGRSTVRELLGIRMEGSSSDEAWLVLDLLNDNHDQRYGMHHADPRRPHVIVPGRDGRCRYEFRLEPGEGVPGQPPSFELAQRLVGRYRDLRPEDVERSVVYTFHAIVADRLRHERIFLLGDAAHMMPPFAGQGLNSGIRDAANLAWKIVALYHGTAKQPLLDSYEAERKPHALATVRFSCRLGEVVMTTSRPRAAARDAVVRAALLSGRGRRYLEQMRFRPPNRISDGLILPTADRAASRLIGLQLPQPRVLRGPEHTLVRFDDVLGRGFALLGAEVREPDWRTLHRADLPLADPALIDVRLDDRASRNAAGRLSISDADGALQNYFGKLRGRFVLVRPDRVIAAVFTADDVAEVSALLNRYLRKAAGAAPAASQIEDLPPQPATLPTEGALQ